ncbi:MAG: ImmA/IrrE family metallo-endopeptidase [Roseburia sp.]|nr:ImmA/IrrE family metallo-endopeptidase [Roseburia sp.]
MYTNLPKNIVDRIKEEVSEIRMEYHIINPIIRTDIFEILDKACIVLRYPLEDEEANGVHVRRWIKGEERNFVFINTGNYIEKQVYTAAHELGHVWRIDEKVRKQIKQSVDSEAVINRFAAELLIPDMPFSYFFTLKCREYGISGRTVEDKDFVRIIVYLMNMFMVPYKAVVYRLEEAGIVDTFNRQELEQIERDRPEMIIDCIQAEEYRNIMKTDRQKSMSGLYNMLEQAEAKAVLSEAKLARIRKLFEYSKRAAGDEGGKITIQSIPKE